MMKMNKIPDETNGTLAEKPVNYVQDMTSTHKIFDEQHDDDLKASDSGGAGHGFSNSHPTSYLETMTHLFKGNIGPGLFAMGDAFKNCGILLAPFLTVALGIVCVHSQHILLKCSRLVHGLSPNNKSGKLPDFAQTVELCFQYGPPRFQPWSKTMKLIVNIFLCVTQLGICCVYFVFISSNLKQVFDYYDIILDARIHMMIIFIPILLPSLITNLKYLAPCSTFANFCMITGIAITMYYACQDLPSITERKYVASLRQLPLFFGTAIFAFEGIGLVLPLQNAMKVPGNFYRYLGVLNVGMTVVTSIFTTFGFIGYLKYGEDVEGSLTLNLPAGEKLAQSVKIIISMGVLLGYALQFFIAIQILWPSVMKKYGPYKHPYASQLMFRTFMVFVTFLIAEFVPKLSLFISLIGALCSTALALVVPPTIELVVSWKPSKGIDYYLLAKNLGILTVALIGFATGSYQSLSDIIKEFLGK